MFCKDTIARSIMILGVVSVLSACQSNPPTSQQKGQQKNTQNRQATSGTILEVTRRSVPVIRSQDGVQDLPWKITQIQNRKALFFNQIPSLTLQSHNQRFIGNTGCNSLYGSYEIDVAKQTIRLKASAGHQMCDNALVQEADLMDALARVEYFQLQGKIIRFMDANRRVLMQAEN